jgi:hypothetical protein
MGRQEATTDIKGNPLWQELIEHEANYIQARMAFFNQAPNKLATIQTALHDPAQRGTAFRLLDFLPLDDRQRLFPDLLELASVAHSDLDQCRQAILTLPKQWLLAHIETTAETLLDHGTDEEYRRLLELYLHIDRALAQRLATQALHHPDSDIREVGEDFDHHLKHDPILLAG